MTDTTEALKLAERWLSIRRIGSPVLDHATAVIEALAKHIKALAAENVGQAAEIARHHKDFAAWEAMAEKGAAQIGELERLHADNAKLIEAGWRVRYSYDGGYKDHGEAMRELEKVLTEVEKS